MPRLSKAVKRARRLEKFWQSGQWEHVIAQLKQTEGSIFGGILQVDAEQNWKVVSIFFEMDLSINSPWEYYTSDELEAIRKEHGHGQVRTIPIAQHCAQEN